MIPAAPAGPQHRYEIVHPATVVVRSWTGAASALLNHCGIFRSSLLSAPAADAHGSGEEQFSGAGDAQSWGQRATGAPGKPDPGLREYIDPASS